MSDATTTQEAYVLSADGRRTVVTPANGRHFRLRQMQGYVGGLIEVLELGGGRLMVINEEGKLTGLPRNESATLLWHVANADSPFALADCIVGPALVCASDQLL